MHHLRNIDAYIDREVDGETLAEIDAHVSGCLACATALSERSSAADRWDRRGLLGRLVRVPPAERIASVPELEEAAAA
jgi:hypothetical protein